MTAPARAPRPLGFLTGWLWAATSAVLVALSFPNPFALSLHPWGAPLAWFALTPFFVSLEGLSPARCARRSWALGFLMFGAVLYWIALLQEAQGLRVWGWLALSLILSLYVALFGFLYGILRPGSGVRGSLVAAALWTSVEAFRGCWPFGGFTWGQIGFAHAACPALLAWTAWGGVWVLTFASAFTAHEAAGVFLAWREGGRRVASLRLAGLGALLAVLYGAGAWMMWRPAPGTRTFRVACLQPNVDQSVKWSKHYEEDTYRILERLTVSVAPLHPALTVWPETASPNFLLWSPTALERVSRMVRNSGVPTLVGCLDAERQRGSGVRQYNAAVFLDGSGAPVGAYHKRHLVPFGEYVPFQRYLAFLGPVVADLGSFERGAAPAAFQADGFRFAPLICYEAIFPRDVRSAAGTGADLLVNISNDAWYGRTAALYQHAQLCAALAASVRRPMARAANTGISFLADASGRVTASTPWWKEEALVGDVPAADGSTFYARFGDWFPWGCALVVTAAGMAVFLRRRLGDECEDPRA